MQVSKNTLCQEKERPRDESRKMEGYSRRIMKY